MKKSLVLIFTVLAMFAVILTSCGKKVSSSVEIAAVGPYSGDLAPYGIPTKRAVDLVFSNSDTVTVNAQDDQCDPSVAANVASGVISTKAVVVIGHICSGATSAALKVYQQTGVAAISPSATNPDLTKSGEFASLFFRTIAPDDSQGKTQADFLVDTLGVQSVAVVHDKGDYGKGLAEYTRAALEVRGVSIALFDGITVGAADYSTVVNKIASANVDAVVFGGYHPEASKLISQMKSRGVEAAFISGDGIKGDAFLQLAGDATEGVYATGPKDNSGNTLYKQAQQQYKDTYSEDPGPFFYEGYSAALVVKETIAALVKSGTEITPQAVRDYLSNSSNTFDTPVGTISFNSQGDATGVGFSVYQVKNGVYQELK